MAEVISGSAKIFLGLVLHNHQPVGNFPSVFGVAYEQSYLPMIEALERHPSVRLSLHYSGPLLDWITVNRPEFISRLKNMASRGQVEIVGGGYYEPILPGIPDSDKVGQIRMMADYCEKNFGQRPRGLWLAERVWEPALPVHLAAAGVGWTVVDDTHFKMVGLDDECLHGYFVTEDQGYPVNVFSTSKYLRYSIPFQAVDEVLAYLRQSASSSEARILVMGDDGEKFGVWPKTWDHCWGKGCWIERFFKGLEDNSSWLITTTPGDFSQQFPPSGRIYLPCASYDEMLEWALPYRKSQEFVDIKHELEAEGHRDITAFMKGGFWRHFGVKYPEVNWMQKRMLHAHRKVEKARDVTGVAAGQDELWKSQCNCPYWHGVFGGLYLADIRATTYRNIIDAERKADAAVHGQEPWLTSEELDLDNDGHKEIAVEGSAWSAFISPRQGGALVEWDLHSPCFNVLSSLARRPEAYHSKLSQKGGGKPAAGTETIHSGIHLKTPLDVPKLSYDRMPRFSLLDHLLSPELDLQAFSSAEYDELADFAGLPYEARVDALGDVTAVRLTRLGHVMTAGSRVPLRLEKNLVIQKGREALGISYTIRNEGSHPVAGILGVEWNINLLGGGHNDQAYYEIPGRQLSDTHLDSSGELDDVENIVVGNRYLGIRLELSLDPVSQVWRFPVETISNSEDGVEGLYQASCILIRFPLSVLPGCEARLRMDWKRV